MSTVQIAQTANCVKNARCTLRHRSTVKRWIEKTPAKGITRALLLLLADYASHVDGELRAWPAQKTISRRLGVSLDTVQRALKRLQALGLVVSSFRYTTAGKRTSNLYTICFGSRPQSAAKPAAETAHEKPAETKPQAAPDRRVQEIPLPRKNLSPPPRDEGVTHAHTREAGHGRVAGVLRQAVGWLVGRSSEPIAVDRTVLEADEWADFPEFGPEHAALGWRGVCHG